MKVRHKQKLQFLLLIIVITLYFCINYINLDNNINRKTFNQEKDARVPSPARSEIILNHIVPKSKETNKSASKYERTYTHYNRKKFLMLNRGAGSPTMISCEDGIQIEERNAAIPGKKIDFEVYLDSVPFGGSGADSKFLLVYGMESEPHSGGGTSWTNADFRMWYNLDLSYPGPATYFDVHGFLPDLIAPPIVGFEKKETSANIVWVLSNCHAFNKRQMFVKNLMSKMQIDSFGNCLQNKKTHSMTRMHGNIELYSKYKFVIAIENSNCEDYVTEKLVHAVASGSIPIVAGRDNKPDYLKFMPKNSYINIYDYKSVDELAKHLEMLSNNKQEYEKYIQFKFNHNYTRSSFVGRPLDEIIKIAKTIINPNEKFFRELIEKETSVSKICKVAKYLHDTPEDVVKEEIIKRKINRPSTNEACLPSGNLFNDFFNNI